MFIKLFQYLKIGSNYYQTYNQKKQKFIMLIISHFYQSFHSSLTNLQRLVYFTSLPNANLHEHSILDQLLQNSPVFLYFTQQFSSNSINRESKKNQKLAKPIQSEITQILSHFQMNIFLTNGSLTFVFKKEIAKALCYYLLLQQVHFPHQDSGQESERFS